MKSLIIFLLFSFSCGFSLAGSPVCLASTDNFPHYPSLQKNVEFWKKVYTKYPSTKGYVHDSHDLSIIYDVVDLLDEKYHGARKKNQNIIDTSKEKYKKILLKLAGGSPAITEDDKKVLDLWGDRVSTEELKAAAENIRFQHCISERFREGLVRSGRHMEAMKKIFRDNGLPVDLVFLPHVESSFDYNAYSKFGAAGIWQFIRSTGQRFLTINYTVDERRDPILATYAAASYLKENYAKLGSWPLALTAYNHGANGMLRAKQQCGDFEKILRDYESRSFGFASRNFYAQFLAAREVAQDYKQYFQNVTMEPALQVQTYRLPGYLALDDLIDYFGIQVSDLRSLNPALRKPVYSGQKYIPKGYEIRLPGGADFNRLIVHLPAQLLKNEQKRSRFYRVNKGDTAGLIAAQHKVKLKDLVESNNLDIHARIFVGQNLVIPDLGERKLQLASLAPTATKSRPPGFTKSDKIGSSVIVEKPSPKNEEVYQKTAVVLNEEVLNKEGDLDNKSGKMDAGQIASQLIEEENVMPETPEQKGEKAEELSSVEDLQDNPAVILGNFQVEGVSSQGNTKVGVISVEAWETLGHYAEWLGVETKLIRSLNKLTFGQPILTSQKIRIPLSTVDVDLFEERRYEFHKGIEEDFFSVFKVVETQKYTVKKGDTVWRLCHEELELPFWLLRKYNAVISFDKLKADQVLIIPVVEKIG